MKNSRCRLNASASSLLLFVYYSASTTAFVIPSPSSSSLASLSQKLDKKLSHRVVPSTSTLQVASSIKSSTEAATTDHDDDNKQSISIQSGSKRVEAQDNYHRKKSMVMELDQFASQCGDYDKSVIDLAMQCQERWEQMVADVDKQNHNSDSNSSDDDNEEPNKYVDVEAFNVVLKAWGKCCHVLAENKRQGLDNSYSMTKTTASTETSGTNNNNKDESPQNPYAQRIHSTGSPIITSKDVTDRLLSLLLFQEQQYKLGLIHERSRPNTYSYNIIMNGYAKSRIPNAPQMTEKLLQLLKDHDASQPDIVSYHTVMDAYTHSYETHYVATNKRKPEKLGVGTAGSKPLDQLHKRQEILETSEASFNKVMQIYNYLKKQHKQYLEKKADGIDVSNEPYLKPSIHSVNSVIHAHAKRVRVLTDRNFANSYSKQANDSSQNQRMMAVEIASQANDLLQEMATKYEETGDEDYMPDIKTYTSVMDVFAQCGTYRATQQCEEVFRLCRQMEKEEKEQQYHQDGEAVVNNRPPFKLNIKTYTTLMYAWCKIAHTSVINSDQAIRRVEILLQQMERSAFRVPAEGEEEGGAEAQILDEDLCPNVRTYTIVMQTFAKSKDPRKAILALNLLRHMKRVSSLLNKQDMKPTIITYNTALDACAKVVIATAATEVPPGQSNNKEVDKNIQYQSQALKIAFAIFKDLEQSETMQPNALTYTNVLKCTTSLLPPGSSEIDNIALAIFNKAKKAGKIELNLVKTLRKSVKTKTLEKLFSSGGGDGTSVTSYINNHGYIEYNKLPSSWTRNV